MTPDTTDADGTRGPDSDATEADAPARIVEQFESIKRTRRRRALGWVGLLGFIVFATIQAFAATELLDPDARIGTFLDSLNEFFPITFYFDVIPFLDFGQYIAFIRDANLLYDPEIVPGMMITSACRGEARGTPAPKRSRSCLTA